MREESHEQERAGQAPDRTVEVERRRLYDVLDSLPAMVCLLSADHEIVFANRTFQETFGKDAPGRRCHEHRFGLDEPCGFCQAFQVLETGEPHLWEVTTPAGRIIEIQDLPFTDPDGTRMILEMDIDVTEARRNETALGDKASDLIAYAPTAMYEMDLTAPRFLSVNDAMVEMTGYRREELLAMDPLELLDEESRELFREWLARSPAGAQPAEDVEYRVRTKDGNPIFVVLRARLIADEQGSPTRAFVIVHDVTEHVRAQAERDELLERLTSELERTTLLQDVALAAAGGLDIEALAQRMLHELSDHLGMQSGDFRLLQPRNRLRLVSSVGLSDAARELIRDVGLDAAGFLAARAVREGRIITHDDDELTPERLRVLGQTGMPESRYVALPLRFAGEPLGALCLTFAGRRAFTLQELDLFSAVASIAAQAVANARAYATEREVADRLQGAMLLLPDSVAGIEFAHAYRAASETARVGGDFYDIFELGRSYVGIVIGDVAGKGLDAAMLTSLAKHTIRAHASERGKNPAQVLALTNEVVCRATTEETFVTVFLGLFDGRDGRLVYSNAGHTSAALVSDEGQIHRLSVTGPILGAYEDVGFGLAEIRIEIGQPLFLYTDGLTEAFREGELYGEDRLFELLGEVGGASVDDIIEQVLADVILFSGGTLRDDLAMLALKRTSCEWESPIQQKLGI